MVVAIALAAAAVLAAVVVLAMGRGGELAEVHPDYPPLPLPTDRRLVAMDAATLRLPRGMWGYHVDATDEMLRRFAHALSERDARLAVLEKQVVELREAVRTHDNTPATAPAPAPTPTEGSWYAPSPETPWSPPDTAKTREGSWSRENPWSQQPETREAPRSQPETRENPWSQPETRENPWSQPETREDPWSQPGASEAPESFGAGNAPVYGPPPPPSWPSGHPTTQELSGHRPHDESEHGK